MPHKLCRLCLSSDRLIYMFDSRLRTQDQLRACILLSTGVEIKEADEVTKFVCNNCCTIAVKLFKFRRNAIANDKALKDYANQNFVEPLKTKEDIAKFNSSLTRDIEKTEEKSPKIIFDIPRRNVEETRNAVHPSVINLYKRHPKIIIPNELLRRNINPLVLLNKSAIPDEMIQKTDEADSKEFENNLEEINYFRKKLPGINIVKIQLNTTPTLNTKEKIKPAAVNKTKTDTNEVRKRHRANSESPEVIPQKKKRLFTKKSNNIQKIDLPESSPKDIESKKIIFTSSLELTSSEKNSSKISPPRFIEPSETRKEIVTKTDTALSESENSFLEPLSNLTVVVCKTCSKIFLTKKQCKIHEKRIHRNCIICHRKHENQTNSYQHLPVPCRKHIEHNQPNVSLTRAEDIPQILLKYADALSMEEDPFPKEEETLPVEEDTSPVEDTISQEEEYETLENFGNEDEYLMSVFRRHTHRVPRESRCIQSFEPDDVVRYENQSSLKLAIMYSDLQVYKVPVHLNIAQKTSASVSRSVKQKVCKGTFNWDSLEVVDLINKAANSSQEQKENSNEKTTSTNLVNIVNDYLSKHIDNIIDLNDKVLFTSSIKPRNGSVNEMTDRLITNKISSKQIVDENSVNLLNLSAENTKSLTIPNNTFTSDTCLNPQERLTKTVDSNSNNKCVLRVKAPWELNQYK